MRISGPSTRAITLALLPLALTVVLASAASAPGASSAVVVSATFRSATSITNSCTASPARTFGVLSTGTASVTATGAGVCRVDWDSSNDTAMLQVMQADPIATAMGRDPGTWPTSSSINSWFGWTEAGATAGTGYASGGVGLHKTTDYGATWTPVGVSSGVSNHLMAVKDDTTLWVSDIGSGNIRKSINSGSSWTNETAGLAMTGNLRGIAAVRNTDTVWAIADDGVIKQQTVAGGAWSAQASNLTSGRAIRAVSASVAWAIGNDGSNSNAEVRRWDGATWTTVADLPTSYASTSWGFQRMYATSASCAWVGSGVGNPGIARTTNGGTSWTVATLPNTRWNDPVGVVFIVASGCTASDHVWAFGQNGAIFHSTDGGATYVREYSSVTDEYTGAVMWDASHVAAVTQVGTATATLDGGTNWVIGNGGASTTYGVGAWNSDTAVAVGSLGRIITTSNGGGLWTTRSTGTYPGLWAVSTAGPTVAVAVGDGGTIVRSSDNGVNWAPVTSGTTEALLAVSMGTATTGWAAGANGVMLRTTDGGATWSPQASTTTERIRDIDAIDEFNAWAVTSAGRWLRTGDGGQTWLGGTLGISAAQATESITATSATTAWISTRGGSNPLWSTTNGGGAWASSASSAFHDLDSFAGGYVIGVGDGFVKTSTDGGATFPTTVGIDYMYAVDMLEPWNGFAGGRGVYRSAPDVNVPDYASGVDDWTAKATGMFGMCLQDVGLSAAVAAPWTEDTVNTPGVCVADNLDPWRALPAAASTLAKTSVAGNSGRVDIVWGLRTGTTQPAGNYSATASFIVVAPAT